MTSTLRDVTLEAELLPQGKRLTARMGSVRLLVLVLALVAAVAACGAAAKAPADSGVRGRVFIGPLCPVVQEGVPCPDAPFEASIRIRRESGKAVKTVRSGKDGRFRVNLAPGRYVLSPCRRTRGLPRMRLRPRYGYGRTPSRASRSRTTVASAEGARSGGARE